MKAERTFSLASEIDKERLKTKPSVLRGSRGRMAMQKQGMNGYAEASRKSIGEGEDAE